MQAMIRYSTYQVHRERTREDQLRLFVAAVVHSDSEHVPLLRDNTASEFIPKLRFRDLRFEFLINRPNSTKRQAR